MNPPLPPPSPPGRSAARPAAGHRREGWPPLGSGRPRIGMCFRAAIVALAVWCGTVPLRAHDPGLSSTDGKIGHDKIELTAGFAPADADRLLPAPMRIPALWTPSAVAAAQPALESIARRMWEIWIGGRVIAPVGAHVTLVANDSLNFCCDYPRPPTGGPLVLRATMLGRLPPGHRQFLMITDEQGAMKGGKLLSAKDDSLEIMLADVSPPPSGTARPLTGRMPVNHIRKATPRARVAPAATPSFPVFDFVLLGVEHIWTGYDHLLFLFGLLIVCGSFRSIVTISSCFTVAHSLTLALATLNLVSVPSRVTEPAIAASIVAVGIENLVRRGQESRSRGTLAFGFGLIHGFGFASVLRDRVTALAGHVGLPLFTFNLGVEVGQIAVAAVVLPVIWQLRKTEWFCRRGVPWLSAGVTVIGGYWFLTRTLFVPR